MAYTIDSINSVTDIPGRIAAFAATRGWAVSGTIITNPSTGTEVQLYGAEVDAAYHEFGAYAVGFQGTREVRTASPRLDSVPTSAILARTVTALHLFGNDAPYTGPDSEPYIIAVVEYGYNLYRHLYIGSVVKLGDYTGGDCLSANRWNNHTNRGGQDFTDGRARFMFSAVHFDTTYPSGGVVVEHADNPNTFRKFQTAGYHGSSQQANFEYLNGTEVIGGHKDGYNDPLLYQSKTSYAAGQILVPINLLAPVSSQGPDNRLRPIGHVPGARLVRLDNLEPGEQILVGGEHWRVFPEFTRSLSTTIPVNSDLNAVGENSHLLGLAYRES